MICLRMRLCKIYCWHLLINSIVLLYCNISMHSCGVTMVTASPCSSLAEILSPDPAECNTLLQWPAANSLETPISGLSGWCRFVHLLRLSVIFKWTLGLFVIIETARDRVTIRLGNVTLIANLLFSCIVLPETVVLLLVVSGDVCLAAIFAWTPCHRYWPTAMCDLVHDWWSLNRAMACCLEPSSNVWQVFTPLVMCCFYSNALIQKPRVLRLPSDVLLFVEVKSLYWVICVSKNLFLLRQFWMLILIRI